MPKGIANPRLKTKSWKALRKIHDQASKAGGPYTLGQELKVLAYETGNSWIPCIPKPMAQNAIAGLTRIPDHTMITFHGLVEVAQGVDLMHFNFEGNDVLVGFGAVPFLKNIPRKGNRSKRPSLSRKAPSRIMKARKRTAAKKKKDRGSAPKRRGR